jgi:hypothetical protein
MFNMYLRYALRVQRHTYGRFFFNKVKWKYSNSGLIVQQMDLDVITCTDHSHATWCQNEYNSENSSFGVALKNAVNPVLCN